MGRVVDPETGLIYLRHRYYDPATAQFLTRDPLDAITRSAYGYVYGNPLNGADPSGLCIEDGCVGEAAAAAAAAGYLEQESPEFAQAADDPGAVVEGAVDETKGAWDDVFGGSGTDEPLTRYWVGEEEPPQFSCQQSLEEHFQDHVVDNAEFQGYGYTSSAAYEQGAQGLIHYPNALEHIRTDNGDTIFSNGTDVAVVDRFGTIRTYFQPTDPTQYWDTVSKF